MSVGLICEFNPFHNGHKYILEQIRKITDEPIICVMSGPFVQRAEPACVNKFIRTLVALQNGADAVVQLPTIFSTSSAENFAKGGVRILKNINGVTSLAFGVETNDIDALYKIAELKNNTEFNTVIKEELSMGISYPNAIVNTIAKLSKDAQTYREILSRPNNILAVEYISALKGTKIKPMPFKRCDNGYNNNNLNGDFASASAIRNRINTGFDKDVEKYLPKLMLENCKKQILDRNLFDYIVLYALRKLSLQDLQNTPDVEQGLEFAIKKASELPSAYEALEKLKTKRYTYARLKRIFLYAALGVTKQVMSDITSIRTRVLGIKNEFKPHLNNFNGNIITRNSDAVRDYTNNNSVMIDAFADDLYSLISHENANQYYKKGMIIV